MKHTLAILVALTAAVSPCEAASLALGNGYGAIDADRDVSPQRLGEMFCQARRTRDMTSIVPYFAPKLERLVAAIPDLEAVRWQSVPGTPTSCTVSITNGYDDTIGVLVEIHYRNEDGQWSDTLNLERTPDSWLLNNVLYETGGNLRFRLVSGASSRD